MLTIFSSRLAVFPSPTCHTCVPLSYAFPNIPSSATKFDLESCKLWARELSHFSCRSRSVWAPRKENTFIHSLSQTEKILLDGEKGTEELNNDVLRSAGALLVLYKRG